MDVDVKKKIQNPTVAFFVSCMSRNDICLRFFCQVVLEKRRGNSKKNNPADIKTVGYCYVTLFPMFPPLLHHVPCEATSKAVGTTQSPFSSCFFSFHPPPKYVMEGEKN